MPSLSLVDKRVYFYTISGFRYCRFINGGGDSTKRLKEVKAAGGNN
tara:strand:- start:4578 stop:4715 length:138 start_codon:yes stop_codon:yes gene_type:complete